MKTTAFFLCLIATLPSAAWAADVPPAGTVRLSRREMATQIERLKETEKRSESDRLIQELRNLLKESGEDPISLPSRYFGSRRGSPDPWAKVSETDVGGRKMRVIAIHANLQGRLADPDTAMKSIPFPERVRRLQELQQKPEWRKRIIESYPTSKGILLIVPVEQVPITEHFLCYPHPESSHCDVIPDDLDEGELETMKAFYLEHRVLETPPISVDRLQFDRGKFRDQRVTIAASFFLHSEGSWLAGIRDITSLGLVGEEGGRLLRRSGDIQSIRDLKIIPRDRFSDAYAAYQKNLDLWQNGNPVFLTGRLRVGDFPLNLGGVEKNVARLEVESIRETTAEDPAWKAAQEAPKPAEKKK